MTTHHGTRVADGRPALMTIDGRVVRYRWGTAETVRELFKMASLDDDTIQAWDMARVFADHPHPHNTSTLRHALSLIGASFEDDDEATP